MRREQGKDARSLVRGLRPGFGSKSLHLGMSEEVVKEILGSPERTIHRFVGSHYYVYKDRGISLDFGKRGGRLKTIFCYRGNGEGHRDSGASTDMKVKVGDRKETIVKTYGTPDRQGNPVLSRDGTLVADWYFYDSGIQFDFGLEGLVDVLIVCKPTKRRAT